MVIQFWVQTWVHTLLILLLCRALAGIGITFANSDINFRVGDMGVYLAGVGQTSSFSAIEIIGMNINGLELVVRGNGR